MALIMSDYMDYFVWWRGTFRCFQRGMVSYFDPIERTFHRINPSQGENPPKHWILLPVIKEVDAIKRYLRLRDNTTYLYDMADLDDVTFCVRIAELAEKYGFEDSLWGYICCYYNECILNWLEENQIPNCRLDALMSDIVVITDDDRQKVREYNIEYRRKEKQQEEEFKKSQNTHKD